MDSDNRGYLQSPSRFEEMPVMSMVGKILRAIATIFVFLLLVLGFLAFQYDDGESAGKQWCNGKIREIQENPPAGLSGSLEESMQGSDIGDSNTPVFTVHSDGTYECQFGITSGLFPTIYSYSSTTSNWEIID
jgi:hypothetical protein